MRECESAARPRGRRRREGRIWRSEPVDLGWAMGIGTPVSKEGMSRQERVVAVGCHRKKPYWAGPVRRGSSLDQSTKSRQEALLQ